MGNWHIELSYIEDWLSTLDDEEYFQTMLAITYLAEVGPAGGRPYIDRITGSKLHNLKELRPRGAGKFIRILFIFDPDQDAILLVAGDKTGNWNKWYKQNIPQAEKIYAEYRRSKHDLPRRDA